LKYFEQLIIGNILTEISCEAKLDRFHRIFATRESKSWTVLMRHETLRCVTSLTLKKCNFLMSRL